MTISVRRADRKDFNQIEQFFEKNVSLVDPEVTSWMPNIYPTIDTVKQALSRSDFYIAEINETIVGSVILNHTGEEEHKLIPWADPQGSLKKILFIHTLMTAVEYQRSGIASKMLDFSIELARDTNCQAVRLDVLENNLPAKRLYESKGFINRGSGTLASFDNKGFDWCNFYERVI
ncbi:GNAT family N-acetyltransferase [Candidatus Enterococcus ferrettii]|uniref:N-acetyltransferase domain-containing protein n=1 Tax=Candidatus Enterococcus ferrettii TaxID=2815324 RepID=A0ABV0EU88_9ENTE|nr:GNAT family N-acetyltransferase [Enterococcus sp. 665A]